MAALIPENFETVAPSEADALLARESSRRLARASWVGGPASASVFSMKARRQNR